MFCGGRGRRGVEKRQTRPRPLQNLVIVRIFITLSRYVCIKHAESFSAFHEDSSPGVMSFSLIDS